MRAALITVSASLAVLVSTGAASIQQGQERKQEPEHEQEGVTERTVKMEDLPRPVAVLMRKELGDKEPEEIEAIIYEGVVVLYEAEYTQDGKELEIVVRPWGELVPAVQEPQDDDPDEGEDDQRERAQPAGAQEQDAVQEERIEISALPKPVADAFKKQLGDGPYSDLEQISYEGIVILYEAELDKGEVAVFPNGDVAQPMTQEDVADDEEDEDDNNSY